MQYFNALLLKETFPTNTGSEWVPSEWVKTADKTSHIPQVIHTTPDYLWIIVVFFINYLDYFSFERHPFTVGDFGWTIPLICISF